MGDKQALRSEAKYGHGAQAGNGSGKTRGAFRIIYKIDPDSPFAKSFNDGRRYGIGGQAIRPIGLAKSQLRNESPGAWETNIEELAALGQAGKIPAGALSKGFTFALFSLAALQLPMLASNVIQTALNSAKGYKQENARTGDIPQTMVNLMPPNYKQAQTEEKTKNQILQENMKKIGEGLASLNSAIQANDVKKVEKARDALSSAMGQIEKQLDASVPMDKTILTYIGALTKLFYEDSLLQGAIDGKYGLKKYYTDSEFSNANSKFTVPELFGKLSEINVKLLENINGLVAKELAEKNITEGRHDKPSKENILKDVPSLPVVPLQMKDDLLTKKYAPMQIITENQQEQNTTQKQQNEQAQNIVQNQQSQQVQKNAPGLTNTGTSKTSTDYVFHTQQLLYRRDFKVTDKDLKDAKDGVNATIASLLGTYGYNAQDATAISKFVRENNSFTQGQFDSKFGAGTYAELQAILDNAAQNIKAGGMKVYGFASMEVLQGDKIYESQKKSNIILGGDRAQLGKEGMIALFDKFGIKADEKQIQLNKDNSLKFIDTDVNGMCRYLEGEAYIHPATKETLRIKSEGERKIAKMHLDYMLENRIISKDWNGDYVAPDKTAFKNYVSGAANGTKLGGADNPFMVLNRGVSLSFKTDVRLRISTIDEQSGKPNEPILIPGKVDMLLPETKGSFDRTGKQWDEKVPVTAGVYLGEKKVADAVFNRETGMFEVPGLKTGNYELRASARMGDLTASVTVPIKISGLVSPAQISSVDAQNRTVTFKASIQSDANAQINANGYIYYSFGTFEKEGGKWVANIYDKDAALLGQAQVLDKQGKPATGNIEEGFSISYKGTTIGASILKGRDMLPSFSIDEETGKVLVFMEDNGLVSRVPIQKGTCTIKTEDRGNVFPREPSCSSAFVPGTVKLR
ncbi:MAG: hypothetical protein WC506_02890 [Candidatus Micrarchaeia archaeon]